MKILITGSKGQLGNALQCLINNDDSMIGRIPPCYSSCEIIAVDIDDLDITDRKAVLSFASGSFLHSTLIKPSALTKSSQMAENVSI